MIEAPSRLATSNYSSGNYSLFAKLILSLSVITLIALNFSSCGYQLKNSTTILPPNVRKIYIPSVENLTTEVQLTQLITEALREEFEKYGVVTVTETPANSDATLTMKIVEIKRSTKTTTGRSDVDNQRNTSVKVSGNLVANSGKVLWASNGLSVTKGFGTDQSTVVSSSADFLESPLGGQSLQNTNTRELQRGQEQEALEGLAEEVAQKIYLDAVSEDF